MKALLIADDENVLEKIKKTLIDDGFDVITYKWLLKALDNIEEIAPEVIIVQASSYPRHWKTLVQFVKSEITGFIPKVILYSEVKFSDEDINKSEVLGINGIIYNIDDQGLKELSLILSGKNTDCCSFIFTNPKSGAFITGNVTKFSNNIIDFIPCSENLVANLEKNQEIPQATIKYNNSIKCVAAKIINMSKNNQKLEIQVI